MEKGTSILTNCHVNNIAGMLNVDYSLIKKRLNYKSGVGVMDTEKRPYLASVFALLFVAGDNVVQIDPRTTPFFGGN